MMNLSPTLQDLLSSSGKIFQTTDVFGWWHLPQVTVHLRHKVKTVEFAAMTPHVYLPSTVTINCYITLSTGYSACIGHNPYPNMASLAVSYDTYGVFTQVTCSELLFPLWFSHLSWKAHNPWWDVAYTKIFPRL